MVTGLGSEPPRAQRVANALLGVMVGVVPLCGLSGAAVPPLQDGRCLTRRDGATEK